MSTCYYTGIKYFIHDDNKGMPLYMIIEEEYNCLMIGWGNRSYEDASIPVERDIRRIGDYGDVFLVTDMVMKFGDWQGYRTILEEDASKESEIMFHKFKEWRRSNGE